MVELLRLTFYSILIGFLIDLLIGDPRFLPHPICAIGFLISKTEKNIAQNISKNVGR